MTVTTRAPAAASVGPAPRPRLVLVSGMSGAGKTTALKALEDAGYEAVDNLPVALLSVLLAGLGPAGSALAVDIDIRTRDFTVETFATEIVPLLGRRDLDARVLFIDCDDDVLGRRYTETRRRHPLAHDRPVIDGIRHERALIAGLRAHADLVIDTSALSVTDLRRLVRGHFAIGDAVRLRVFVTSFSYRAGVPREADLVFDVRFLANPHYVAELKALTGCDPEVAAFVAADPDYPAFFERLTAMLLPLLPRFEREGKTYLTIAVGCTGGRHRSVFVAERLAETLAAAGRRVHVRHRDLNHRAA